MATILIVDDLASNRKLLVRLLARDGHNLIEASNGRQALDVVRATNPDLVITDVLMPIMDGYGLARDLRRDPATAHIPVVFFTAHYGEREARELALSCGRSYVLTKPTPNEEIRRFVDRVLSTGATAATNSDISSADRVSTFDREHLRLVTDKLSEKVDDLRVANTRLRALINIGLELAAEADADRVFQGLCDAALDLFGATYATLGLVDPHTKTVQRLVMSGSEGAGWIGVGDSVTGVIGTVVADARTIRQDNPSGDPTALGLPSLHPLVKTVLATPLASPSQTYGWLCLIGNEGQAFTVDDEQLIAAMAGQVGRIYENKNLHAVTHTRAQELAQAEERIELERQQAKRAQQRTEARYRKLFECAPDGIVIADSEATVLEANDSLCRMLGYTKTELVGLRAAQLVAAEEVGQIQSTLDQIRAKADHHREWQFRRKDGTFFPAEVLATQMSDGKILSMIRDVTDRKRADEQTAQALRELNDVKAAIDEHAIVAITDPKGKITYVNDKFCRISQYSREELIGKDHRIINSGLHSKEFIRNLWQTIGAGRVWKGEIKNRAKDGTFYWVETTIVPRLGEDGRPIQYIAIRADITERKHFEQVLQEKNVELEAASRMKSEFLANMSHELRTPLNAIIGFSEVLKDGITGPLAQTQHKFVCDIFNSGTHLLSLINDILDLSKVEAGKMVLDLEPVHLSALLTNSLSIIREKALNRRIGLSMELADDLGAIDADSRKVKQVVYNLLANAVKFTSDGGQVLVRATRVTRAQVGRCFGKWPGRSLPLADHAFEDFVEIRVTDNGIGISTEQQAQLFRPFNQIDSGLARKFEGTGLGLAMVKSLTELHGGTVAVESAVGEGSSFAVWLPTRGRADDRRTLEAAGDVEAMLHPTALVVEQDSYIAELMGLQLESEGFRVVRAESVDVAVALAAQEPLALIVLDTRRPKSSGRKFLERIKLAPALRRIPIVTVPIVAAARDAESRVSAIIGKPVSRQALHQALTELGLLPLAAGQKLRVLVVDDDPKAVDLITARMTKQTSTVLPAYGGREAISAASQLLPDLIILDLMMPRVNGFDVVDALRRDPRTAGIPILVVTAKGITLEDRTRLNGSATPRGHADFDADRFTANVRSVLFNGRKAS